LAVDGLASLVIAALVRLRSNTQRANRADFTQGRG
jgi:hypothetical protein